MTDLSSFQQTVWKYYHHHGRHDLPWRMQEPDGSFDPYKILVSELMLQQTQVGRVIPKFLAFIAVFPSFQVLAQAPLSEVLRMWSGLGYNRRAKFLHQTAQAVVGMYGGLLPRSRTELITLPGIGHNTAGAILAYAFDQPVGFVETNIRTVFIHHFFSDQQKVADSLLTPLIEQSIPASDVRLWYWALMDYGTHLKQTVGNFSRSSAGYAKQSAFHGSRRQIRGQILKLLAQDKASLVQLAGAIADERLDSVLEDLVREGFIELTSSRYQLRA